MNTHTETYRRNAFADTEIFVHTDPITLTVLARYRRQKELARLARLCVAWVVAKVVAWHRRAAVHRELSAKPDHWLADMGIRRNQIAAIADGRLSRPETEIETAVAQPQLAFLDAKPRVDKGPAAETKTLAA